MTELFNSHKQLNIKKIAIAVFIILFLIILFFDLFSNLFKEKPTTIQEKTQEAQIPKKNYKKRNKTTINKLFNGKKKDKKYLPNVIKKFYKNIKLKGCLYSIPKIECNTFMMRKFHKKYDSAEKNKK